MKLYKNEHKMWLPTKFSLFVKGLPHREFFSNYMNKQEHHAVTAVVCEG